MTAVSLGVFRPPGVLADLLLTAVLALLVAALFTCLWSGLERIEVYRRVPRVATRGETLVVVHEVRNAGRRLVQGLIVHERPADPSAEALPAGNGSTFFPQVLPGLRAEARTRLFVGRRGPLRLAGVSLTLGDPFGLFVCHRELALPGEVLVQPRVRRSAGVSALANTVRRIAGEAHTNEWSKVREYRSGDPLRSVHWRLTARRGTPVVRTADLPRGGRLWIVLDRRAPVGRRGQAGFELAVSLAAGLGKALLEQGAEVRFSAPGREPGEGLELSRLRGRSGGDRLLDALALVRPEVRCAPLSEDTQAAIVVTAREAEQVELPCALVLEAPRLPSLPPRIVRRPT